MRFLLTSIGQMLVALALLAGTSGIATAQPPADSSDADATSWYAFPTVFYTPETSLGLGAAGGVFMGTDADRPSSLQGDVSATLNGQYALNLRPEWYRQAGRQRVVGDIALSTYPDVFYGLGPEAPDEQEEDFTSRYVDAILQAEQQVGAAWRVGLRGRVRREVVTEVEAGGLLDGPALPGHDASTVVGLGPLVTRDTRDRLFYPRRGQFVTAYLVVHPEALGSTFGFTRVVLDARQYVPLGWGHTLAVPDTASPSGAFPSVVASMGRSLPAPAPWRGGSTPWARTGGRQPAAPASAIASTPRASTFGSTTPSAARGAASTSPRAIRSEAGRGMPFGRETSTYTHSRAKEDRWGI